MSTDYFFGKDEDPFGRINSVHSWQIFLMTKTKKVLHLSRHCFPKSARAGFVLKGLHILVESTLSYIYICTQYMFWFNTYIYILYIRISVHIYLKILYINICIYMYISRLLKMFASIYMYIHLYRVYTSCQTKTLCCLISYGHSCQLGCRPETIYEWKHGIQSNLSCRMQSNFANTTARYMYIYIHIYICIYICLIIYTYIYIIRHRMNVYIYTHITTIDINKRGNDTHVYISISMFKHSVHIIYIYI